MRRLLLARQLAALGILGLSGHARRGPTRCRSPSRPTSGAPMQRIAAEFQKDTGHRAELSLGATGKFYAQIRNGAPFEILLGRRRDAGGWPTRAPRGAGEPLHLRHRRLVLWSARPGGRRPGRGAGQGRFEHLAIANPKTAPYGAAASRSSAGCACSTRWPALVHGREHRPGTSSSSPAATPKLGFVALSQVWLDGALGGGSAWIVPATAARRDPPGRRAPAARARRSRRRRRCWPTCAATGAP